MAFQEKQVPADAPVSQKVLAWVDSRFPLTATFEQHMSKYYAPKNLNFFYIFGALAIVVLAIQIITGIFLVMNYKPDAAKAFAAGRGEDDLAWRRWLSQVRAAAVGLARQGRLVIYRKGKPADPDDFRGVYRLGLPRSE